MRKWWIVPLIMIAALAIGVVGAAWSQRPIIEYTFAGCPDTFNSLSGPMGIRLKIKNTGNIYSRLNLILTVKNANISSNTLEQYIIPNGTQLKMLCDLPSVMETYHEYFVYIEPVNDPENFTANLAIENLADWSVPNGFICKFLEPHGYNTRLTYNKTDDTKYELIQ